MKLFTLPYRHFAPAFWRVIAEHAEHMGLAYNDTPTQTGKSLPLADCRRLFNMVAYFQPAWIVECGTGASTHAMWIAQCGYARSQPTEMWTCDRGGFEHVRQAPYEGVHEYPVSFSELLTHVPAAQAKLYLDFVFLDGRITAADAEYLLGLLSPRAVIAIDDYEGIEKGVANAMLLGNGRIFVAPEPGSRLAVLLPKVQWSAQ